MFSVIATNVGKCCYSDEISATKIRSHVCRYSNGKVLQ